MKIEIIDLDKHEHCEALLMLLNEYMEDEMGNGESMSSDLGKRIINGLKLHSGYLGFLVAMNGKYVGLANCNINYSTWKAGFIINIHDFIVHSGYRKLGVGHYLLREIEAYALKNKYCKINLEVREDNYKARSLYKKTGFVDCKPPMLFWEKVL